MCGGGSAPGNATSSTSANAPPVSSPLVLKVANSLFPTQYAVPPPGGTCVVLDVNNRASLPRSTEHPSSQAATGGLALDCNTVCEQGIPGGWSVRRRFWAPGLPTPRRASPRPSLVPTPSAHHALDHPLVDEAPAPVLARLEGLHDRVARGVEVLGGVRVLGVVAAADVAADQAHSQVDPGVAGL